MGVRLRTTLTATVAVAVVLGLASVVLFGILSSSLKHSTQDVARQDSRLQVAGVLGEMSFTTMPTATASPKDTGTRGATATPEATGLTPAMATVTYTPESTAVITGLTVPFNMVDLARGLVPLAMPLSIGSSCANPGLLPSASQPVVIWTTSCSTIVGPVSVTGQTSTKPVQAALDTLKKVLVPGVPAMVVLVALLTWWLVGRTLRPVSAIRAKVADITANDLHERVPEPGGRNEIGDLARTVNSTLDRLQSASEAHRQFVADAAHELRSPIATLRTRLELAEPEEKQLATDALDDVERLQSLTSDLLLLARLDAQEPIRAVEVDLAQLVAEEAARTRPRPEIGVGMHLTPDLLVDGSPDHLRRLVANLVDNAVRHATTTVTVVLTQDAGHALLDISDDGPGIPPEHRGAVFDRFTRLDHARTRDTGGAGLGLSIARDIATAHHADLSVLPRSPGAHFRAVIPLRA